VLRSTDAETIVGATLDQAGKWIQGDLLRTKARIQVAHGQFGDAVETCSNYLLILHCKKFRTSELLSVMLHNIQATVSISSLISMLY